jgi:ribosomal protein S18 acetylase RimI-like enzyme
MNVRLVRADDVEPLGAVLARSFDADPVFRAILPDDAHRARALPILFVEWLRRLHLPLETTYTTDDHAGAALWSPPGRWHIGVLQQAAMAPRMLGALRGRTLTALRVLLAIESPHPHRPPHYYLRVIGCDPTRQGQGVGAALLRPVLDRCDAEGVGAYLESSNERNVPFYRRLGFEVTGEVRTHLGPKASLMWREPAAAAR